AVGQIHGDMEQAERIKELDLFKAETINILVASDVAARGLDIKGVSHVFNYDVPWQPDDYIHRIGRTGRAGATGEAISLVSQDEGGLLRAIQRVLKADIAVVEVEGYVPTRGIRMGNDNPTRGRPAGNRPPPRREGAPRGRRPHGGGGDRHAHAGPKGHGPRGGGERRQGTTDSR
ncbi:MAG TPA: helicase-related protein, partial [Arenimonas sp.]|nr:helicase-related protein [Arenimonas sp.]